MPRSTAGTVQANADEIVRLRQGKVWTQKELAAKSGVPERTLGRAEAGARVRVSTLADIAEALGVEPGQLMLYRSHQQATGPYLDATRSSEPDSPPAALAGLGQVPEGLRRHLCSFDALIEDRTRDFVGREFLFEALDELLEDPLTASGYFVIRGEPGIGKSSFLAALVKKRAYSIHHFKTELQGLNTARQFLGNICARLVIRHKLPYEELPDTFDEDGSFLNKVLYECAQTLDTGDRLVVAIDALDEVEQPTRKSMTNTLFLPANLPAHVYVVATTRPGDTCGLQANCLRFFDLTAQSGENLKDVRAYVRRQTSHEGIQAWIREQRLTTTQFVDTLLDKSAGNFMYLHYVLPAIDNGSLKDSLLKDLPEGLRSYYRGHWTKMRNQDPGLFDKVFRPIVCVLAAVMEPVSVCDIAGWTRLEQHTVRNVIREWRQFLAETPGEDGQRLYGVYHASFKDFLQEEVDPGLRTYHSMIAECALRKVSKRKLNRGK